MDNQTLKIGEVAKAVGLNPRAIRYYERRGLLKASRNLSRYRVFEAEDLARLKLVKQLRRLGFSIAETKELLPVLMDSLPQTQRTKRLKVLLNRRLAESEAKLRETLAIHQELRTRLVKLSSKRRRAKVSCCEPFCGPQTCDPGLIQMSGLTEKVNQGGGK